MPKNTRSQDKLDKALDKEQNDESEQKVHVIQPKHSKPIRKSITDKKTKIRQSIEKEKKREQKRSKIQDESEQEQNVEGQLNEKSPLELLEKLKEDLMGLKTSTLKAEKQHEEHTKAAQKLKISIDDKKQSIDQIEKTIRHTQSDLLDKAKSLDRLYFFNPYTFTDVRRFNQFYTNFVEFPQKINACFLSSHVLQINFNKITSGFVSTLVRNYQSKSQVRSIIEGHFENFPYLTVSDYDFHLIQALIMEKQVPEDLKGNQVLMNLPILFMRGSSFSHVFRSKVQFKVYSLLFNDTNSEILDIILDIMRIKFANHKVQASLIHQAASKAILNRQYICLPQINRQIRSLRYKDKVYINTYPLQKKQHYSEEIKFVYSVFAFLRETTNYVYDELIYHFKGQKQTIETILQQNFARKDCGAEMQRIITKGPGFMGVSSHHYGILQSETPDFSLLSDVDYTSASTIIFLEFEKQRNEKINKLSKKYDQIDIQGNLSEQLVVEIDEEKSVKKKRISIEDMVPKGSKSQEACYSQKKSPDQQGPSSKN